jgi:uncharacterized protein YkwD
MPAPARTPAFRLVLAAFMLAPLMVCLGCAGDPAPPPQPPPYAYGYPPQYAPPYQQYPQQYPQPYPQPYPQRPQYPPPAAPAYPDALAKYNVDLINSYRAQARLPPLAYDGAISRYAFDGSAELARDHSPHAHYMSTNGSGPGRGQATAENQGDPNGVPQMAADPLQNGMQQVNTMMKLMMSEGPGGGHYENVMSPAYRRVGAGFFYVGGRLFLTNDFSN